MSVSSIIRIAGPYSGNGATVTFPFAFKVFQPSEVVVVQTDINGVEVVLTITTDYTVTLNADQDGNPGGAITMLTAPAVGYLITLGSNVDALQDLTLTNQGGFYPKVINDALDRITIVAQQILNKLGGVLKVGVSDGSIGDLPSKGMRSDMGLGFDANGDPIAVPLSNLVNAIPTQEKGAAGGVATLNAQSELVQMSAGAAAQVAAGQGGTVKRADGSWGTAGGAAASDIINGQFRVAQAGTSFAPASGSYDLDGWYNLYVLTTPGFTTSRGIGSSTGKFARLNTYNTAESVFNTGDYCNNSTKIEGYDAVKYLGNAFTVGFRVRSSVTGVHCLSIHDGTSSYVSEYTINVADTWEYKTITIAGGLQAVASSTNAWGITLHFCNGVGATGQTTAGAWNAGSFYGTVNQVNDLATVGNVFALEDVTMNLGATAIPDSATYEQELARCQRYLPAFSTIAGTHSVGVGGMVNTTVGYFVIPFLVETRVTVTSAVLSSVSHFTSQGVAAPVATGLGVFAGGKNSALLSLTFPAAVAGVSTLVFANAAGTLRFEGARL